MSIFQVKSFISQCKKNCKFGYYLATGKQLLVLSRRCSFSICFEIGFGSVSISDNSTECMVDAEPYSGSYINIDEVPLGEYFGKS